ncbi:MAG: helix-turn-helix domain-containing protein [Pseudomonadota bacterium]
MADPKLFAGPRLRRIRMRLGHTQTAMAGTLDISPSYLNLLERNQRPVTAQLIIKLAEVHEVDPREVKGEAEGLSVAELRDVFSEPLLADEMPADDELMELREATPNVASGILRLHAAWKDSRAQLAKLTDFLAADERGEIGAARMLPVDAVRHAFTSRPWYFPDLEALADRLRADHGLDGMAGGERVAAFVEERLKDEFGLRVQALPAEAMVGQRRRLDRHSGRIFVSAAMPSQARHIEIVAAWLQLSQIARLNEAVDALALEGEEARRLAASELQFYLALAILLPMSAVSDARAKGMADIFTLAGRHGVSPFSAGLRRIAHEGGQAGAGGALGRAKPGAASFTFCATETGRLAMRRSAGPFPMAELDRDMAMRLAIRAFGHGAPQRIDDTLLRDQKTVDAATPARPTRLFVQQVQRPGDGGLGAERIACFFCEAAPQ